MATTSVEALGGATVAQRWLARLALVTAAAAVLMPPLVAGFRQSVALVLVGLAGLMDWKRLWRIGLTVHRPVRSRPW